jgi:hypothetical protein
MLQPRNAVMQERLLLKGNKKNLTWSKDNVHTMPGASGMRANAWTKRRGPGQL